MKLELPDITRTINDADGVDYEAWAIALCTLLDRIEQESDDNFAVYALCQQRFEIAMDHGLTVIRGGPASGTMP